MLLAGSAFASSSFFGSAVLGSDLAGGVAFFTSAFATSTAGPVEPVSLLRAARALAHSDLLTVTTSSLCAGFGWSVDCGFVVSAAAVVVPREPTALDHSLDWVFGFGTALATAGLSFLVPTSFLAATGLVVFLPA